MILTGKKVILCPMNEGDIDAIYSYMSLPEVAYPACLPLLGDEKEAAEYLKKWIADGRRYAIVLTNGTVIGHISVKGDSEEGREDTRELGFALNPMYSGRGYMTEACLLMKEYLFEVENIRYLWTCCFEENAPSRRVIEKCGFLHKTSGILFDERTKTEKPSYECCAENPLFA